MYRWRGWRNGRRIERLLWWEVRKRRSRGWIQERYGVRSSLGNMRDGSIGRKDFTRIVTGGMEEGSKGCCGGR
jgi:hypothetical protein